MTVHDFKNDQEASLSTDVANENELLASLEKLAGDMREKLASTPEILKELQAHPQHVTTKSIPALKAYDEGLQLSRAGQYNAGGHEVRRSDDPGSDICHGVLQAGADIRCHGI